MLAGWSATRQYGRFRLYFSAGVHLRAGETGPPSRHAFGVDDIKHTDGWKGYRKVSSHGYEHEVTVLKGKCETASELLPRVQQLQNMPVVVPRNAEVCDTFWFIMLKCVLVTGSAEPFGGI